MCLWKYIYIKSISVFVFWGERVRPWCDLIWLEPMCDVMPRGGDSDLMFDLIRMKCVDTEQISMNWIYGCFQTIWSPIRHHIIFSIITVFECEWLPRHKRLMFSRCVPLTTLKVDTIYIHNIYRKVHYFDNCRSVYGSFCVLTDRLFAKQLCTKRIRMSVKFSLSNTYPIISVTPPWHDNVCVCVLPDDDIYIFIHIYMYA